MNIKKIIVGALSLAIALGVAASASAMSWSRSLTVGARGTDVTALQEILIAGGYLKISAPTGYFGTLTKNAVASWQLAAGVRPAVGFFGPISQAKLAETMSTAPACPVGFTCTSTSTPAPVCPVGYTCTSTNGSTTNGSITTPGVEGTIIVSQESSNVKSTLYEGDVKTAVLGFKVEAKTSDALVQRVKVQIGTTTNSYTKVFRKIYLTDVNGNILAWTDLNSSTVNRDSATSYTVTLAGFNALVKKDTKASFYIAFDVNGSISSEYRGTQSVSLAADAVRALDGAGIDQYGNNAITVSPSISRSLSDSATLTLSTDPDVLKAQTIVANGGSANNEADMVTVASFRALAEKDGVLVRDLTVTASSSPTGATQPTAYLFVDGSQIASAAATASTTNSSVTTYAFTSIDQRIARDATKTYSVKVDVRGATTASENFQVIGVGISSAESTTTGTNVSVTALSSVGNTMTFVSNGVNTTLGGSSLDIVTARDQNAVTTEVHLTSTFNVAINAIGADAVFGAPATAFSFKVFKNGADVTSTVASYVTVYYPATQPSGTTVYSSTGFTVPRNASVVIPVGFKIDVTGSSTVGTVFPAGDYSVRLNGITYTVNSVSVTNDNSTNSAWVSATKARP